MGAVYKVNIDGRIYQTVFQTARVSYSLTAHVEQTQRFTYSVWQLVAKQLRQEYDLEANHVYQSARQLYDMTNTVVFRRTLSGGMIRQFYTIKSQVFHSERMNQDLLVRTPVMKKKKQYYQLLEGTTSAPLMVTYGYRVLLDGRDVTAKVGGCDISYSLEQYTGECNITWLDWELYKVLDPLVNMGEVRLEVYTRSSYDDNEWICQGKFLQERRSTSIDGGLVKPTSWGRTITAKMGEPHADPVTKTWEDDTDAFAIAREVIEALDYPIVLRWEIPTYPVLGGNFAAVSEFPADIIGRLAEPLGAIVTTNKQGELIVRYRYV